jgi:hypothetical protein
MHALLLCMLCGCGRTNLGRTDGSSGRDDSGGFPGAEGNGREGGHPNVASTSDTGQPDGSVDVISSPDSRVDARDGPVGDGRTKADSCVPITCTPEGGSYCGLIGNGCGGSLDCPQECIPPGWACEWDHICRPPYECWGGPLTVCAWPLAALCGRVNDGCDGVLECPEACPQPGWVCKDRMCVGEAPFCSKGTCTAASGDSYCGRIGDGCGGSLDCTCPSPDWVCDAGRCIGPPSVCSKIDCAPPGGGQYCGQINDGCGGTLDCGSCSTGAACGVVTPNICGRNEQGLAPPRMPPPAPPAAAVGGGQPPPLPPPLPGEFL